MIKTSELFNIEAEQAVLGAILLNNDAFFRVSDFLRAEHFSEDLHKRIYELSAGLITSGKVATPVTLKSFLGDHDLGGVTVSQYLARIASEASSVISAGDLGRMVRDLSVRRQLVTACEDLIIQARELPIDADVQELIRSGERVLYRLGEHGGRQSDFQPWHVALTEAIERAAEAYSSADPVRGIASGLSDLDHKLGGFEAPGLYVIAATPGMGSTALATNIAFHAARTYEGEERLDGAAKRIHGGRVGFFSLELSAEQLATRIISEQSKVKLTAIRKGQLSEEEFRRVADAARTMQKAPFYIDDCSGGPPLTIKHLAARARKLQRRHGLDLLIIDRLQLIEGASYVGENRTQEMSQVTMALKALAKELNVPILITSDLNRQNQYREDKRPLLYDLRDTGTIEKDANVVIFVHREEYYLAGSAPQIGTSAYLEWQTRMDRHHDRATLIVAKNTHGHPGDVAVAFNSDQLRFADLPPEARFRGDGWTMK